MATKAKKPSRLTKTLLETAKDMRDGGILDAAAWKKIAMRHFEDMRAPAKPLTSKNIRAPAA